MKLSIQYKNYSELLWQMVFSQSIVEYLVSQIFPVTKNVTGLFIMLP